MAPSHNVDYCGAFPGKARQARTGMACCKTARHAHVRYYDYFGLLGNVSFELSRGVHFVAWETGMNMVRVG